MPSVTQTAFASLAAFVMLMPGFARGQVADVEPYYATVLDSGTPMRAGKLLDYYEVAQLAAGTVLLVDGEEEGWARVGYPAGVAGMAKLEVEPIDDNTVRVLRPTTLYALSSLRGVGGSWQQLLADEDALQPGTTLELIETFRDTSGGVVAYAITPPAAARGYVELNDLRRATDEEIAAFEAEFGSAENMDAGDASDEAAEEVVEDSAAEQPAVTDEATEAEVEVEELEATADKATAESIVEDIVLPGDEPEVAVETEVMAEETEVVEVEKAVDNSETTAAPVAEAPADAGPQPLTIEQLEAAFRQAQRNPRADVELDELAVEFRAAIDRLGFDPADRNLRNALAGRLQLLNLRIEARDARRRLAERRRQIDAGESNLSQRLAELERSGNYIVVGRLVPSSLYDGVRVAQLYRVVSAQGQTPRTLGYIEPTTELALPTKTGQLVGVVGRRTTDDPRPIQLIAASRVDVLTPGGRAIGVAPAPSTGSVGAPPQPTIDADGFTVVPGLDDDREPAIDLPDSMMAPADPFDTQPVPTQAPAPPPAPAPSTELLPVIELDAPAGSIGDPPTASSDGLLPLLEPAEAEDE
ncbi:MAG: hypothetical protein AAF747_02670 [Planctomycetota bacterium]